MYTKKNIFPLASVKISVKQGNVSKITHTEIAEIVYVDYADDIYLTKNMKPELTKILEVKIHGNPNNTTTVTSAEYPMIKE